MQSQRAANSCYARVQADYHARCKDKLEASGNAHSWWNTLKESVFGVASSIPPLHQQGGGLASHPRDKAELLSQYFDGKQSRDIVVLPDTCHTSPKFSSFAARAAEVRRLLDGLEGNGGVDPLGFFPLFFKKLSPVLAPKLSIIFRRLIKEGCFPGSWKCANVVPIPKGPLSAFLSDYRPISITPVLSKVYERLVAVRLGSFFERESCLPQRQYAYRKGRGTCDALLDYCNMGQLALDSGAEMRTVQIDFSAAFDRVNHEALIYKLRDVGVSGSVLSIIRGFLSDRVQKVIVDGVCSGIVDVVSGVPQGSVLGPLLFLLYTSELSEIVDNNFIAYADDSTLVDVVPSPADRVSVSASLNRDLEKIGNWCCAWGMKVNSLKTKTMVISRSRTAVPAFPDLVMSGVVLGEEKQLKILGVTFDRKLTFESHLRGVASSAAQKLGILRKAWGVFHDCALVRKCFWSFLLPVLEYCSPVWCSAADCHLALLDRIVRCCRFLSSGEVKCDLGHRRDVACLCMYYKIRDHVVHPLYVSMPAPFVQRRVTRHAVASHRWSVAPVRTRTVQYGKSFIPFYSSLWNDLNVDVFASEGLCGFKTGVNRYLLSS